MTRVVFAKELNDAVPLQPWTLDTLSPIITDFSSATKTFRDIAEIVSQTPVEEIARVQADQLFSIWRVMAGYLNEARPDRIAKFSPGDLRKMFIDSAVHLHLTQIQKPAIFPFLSNERDYQRGIAAVLPSSVRNVHEIYNVRDNIHLHAGARSLFSLFCLITKKEPANLVAIPFAGIEPWIMSAFIDNGQLAALEALQSCIAAVSHDYIHSLKPLSDIAFFSHNALDDKKVTKELKAAYRLTKQDSEWDGRIRDLYGLFVDDDEPDAFEYQLLIAQAEMFENMNKSASFRRQFSADVDRYVTGIKAAADRFRPFRHKGLWINRESFVLGAATILAAYMFRVVGLGDPLMMDYVHQLNRHFEFKPKRIKRHFEGVENRYLPDNISSVGEVVMHNAHSMAAESYGIVHNREFDSIRGFAQRLTIQQMCHIRAGLRNMRRIV